ncbi:hypothetical protein B7463_g6939, partial [Scytalidium lignicola]
MQPAKAIVSYPPINGLQMVATGLCHTDLVYGTSLEQAGLVPRVLGHEGAGYVREIGPKVSVAKRGDMVLLSFASCTSCMNCKDGHPAYCTQFGVSQFSGKPSLSNSKTRETISGGFFGQSSFSSFSIVKEVSVVNVSGLVLNENDLKLFSPLGCGFQTGTGTVTNVANAKPSDTILIIGLGGVGMTAIMAASRRNCSKIIGLDRYPDRLQLATDLGATGVIDTIDNKLNLSQKIQELLEGQGPSITIDTTGVPALISLGLQITAHAGQMILLGYPPVGATVNLDLVDFFRKGKTLRVSIEGDVIPSKAKDHEKAVTDMKNGITIKPVLIWLNEEYGDFVRTGPSEITIYLPEAIPVIYGPSSKCTKAPRYDVSWPTVSMHASRDKTLHDKRRRIWDRAFSTKSLRNYESRVLGYANELVKGISGLSGKTVLANQWFNFYSFDVMGDLAFGKSFHMLSSGKQHWCLDLLYKGQSPLGILGTVPWLFIILARLPGVGTDFRRFVGWCSEQVEERKKMNPEVPDIMSHLLEASAKAENPRDERLWLMGDSRLIIIAGSDTTAITLTHIFYHLAKDQSQVQKLRTELENLNITEEGFNFESVRTASHLNGIINETLRLHHPVPAGLLRVTPPEGLLIAGTFVPGNTTVNVPMWSIGKSKKAYEQPEEFIPERWYSRPELVRNKDAFAPFLIGPDSCIGRQLAMMSLRAVVSLMILHFDVSFAPGEDGHNLIYDSKDTFTLSMADIKFVFKKR